MNAYQKICGIRLMRAGLTKNMITQHSKLYDTVSYPTIQHILDTYATQSEHDLLQWPSDVIHCGDNIDVRKKARHELAGRSSYDFHMYNNIVYKPRILLSHLNDTVPVIPPLEDIDLNQFIPNADEERQLVAKYRGILLNAWNGIQGNPYEAPSPLRETHQFTGEMRQVTEKVGFF